MAKDIISNLDLLNWIKKEFPEAEVKQGFYLHDRFLTKAISLKIKFPNEYGASILREVDDKCFEVGALRWDGNKWEMAYHEKLSNNVFVLTLDELIGALEKIQELE